MTQSVWKFTVGIADERELEMPRGAKILHARVDPENPMNINIWARVDINEEPVPTKIYVRGTGHQVEPELKYVITTHDDRLMLVWHIFVDRTTKLDL